MLWWENKNAAEKPALTRLCSAISKQHNLSINNQPTEEKGKKKKKSNHQHKEKHMSFLIPCWDWSLATILAHHTGRSSRCHDPQTSQGLRCAISTSVENLHVSSLFRDTKDAWKTAAPTQDAFLHVLHARLQPNYFNLTRRLQNIGLVAQHAEAIKMWKNTSNLTHIDVC